MRYQLAGDGPAVVLIPGLAATANFFGRTAADLRTDHTVVTVDLPGHGATPVDGNEPTLRGAAAGLGAVIEELDLDEVTLLGWSLGASVAYTYLERFGAARVAALISVEQTPYLLVEDGWEHAAFGALDEPGARALQSTLESDIAPFTENLVTNSFATGSQPDPALLAELIAEAHRCDAAAIRGLLADVLGQDFRKGIGEIRVPTLLIHGARSGVYPTPVGRWLADTLPDGRLETFEHSGHLPFVEEPERFTETVRAFVASVRRQPVRVLPAQEGDSSAQKGDSE